MSPESMLSLAHKEQKSNVNSWSNVKHSMNSSQNMSSNIKKIWNAFTLRRLRFQLLCFCIISWPMMWYFKPQLSITEIVFTRLVLCAVAAQRLGKSDSWGKVNWKQKFENYDDVFFRFIKYHPRRFHIFNPTSAFSSRSDEGLQQHRLL